MSSSPAKGTTVLFQYSAGNFTKANRQSFIAQINAIKPVLEATSCPKVQELIGSLRESRSSSDRDGFIYPTTDNKNVIFVRNSTLTDVRNCCIDLLGLVPEKEDEIIRKFLISTETIAHQSKHAFSTQSSPHQSEGRQFVLGT